MAMMESGIHPDHRELVSAPTRKERRASLVIRETAQTLEGLRADANRSNALMAELEALLSASQAASGSGVVPGAVFASANFSATQPLELSSDIEDDLGVDDNDEEIDADAAIDELASRRIRTMLSLSRTGSVTALGPGHGQESPLFIAGTSASFCARPQALIPSVSSSAAAATGGERRRSLSFCNQARVGTANPGARYAPSQSSIRAANSFGPPSASFPRNGGTNPGSVPWSGVAGAAGPEPNALSASQAAVPVATPVATERRPAFVAWIASRSPTRRSSRTAETPVASAAATAAAAARPPSPQRKSSICEMATPQHQLLRPLSPQRKTSVCEVAPQPRPLSPRRRSICENAPTSRSSQALSRRAVSTNHVSFLPRLGHRESDTSGGSLNGSGGGAAGGSGGGGGGGGGSGRVSNNGGGAPMSPAAGGGGGFLRAPWITFMYRSPRVGKE